MASAYGTAGSGQAQQGSPASDGAATKGAGGGSSTLTHTEYHASAQIVTESTRRH